jgi:hypothetical protein
MINKVTSSSSNSHLVIELQLLPLLSREVQDFGELAGLI